MRSFPGLAIAGALITGLLVLACGGKPPQIPAVEWRIEKRASPLGAYESLSVFANIRDEDGIENIDELWVAEDAARLAWRLTSSNWVQRTEGADTWIGAAGLTRSDYQSLPRGDYRVMAIDLAGDRAEKGFRLDGSFPDRPPPSISLVGGELRIRSSWPENLVLAFDAAGMLLESRNAPEKPTSLAALLGGDALSKTSEVSLYGYDPPAHAGYYSRRIPAK